MFIVRCLFSLSHFFAVQDYELSKSKIYLLSAPLTLECVKILSWSISFFLLQLSPWWSSVNDCCMSWWYCSQLIKWQTIWLVAKCWDLNLKMKIARKYFYFPSVTFRYIMYIRYLKLSIQVQTLDVVIQNSLKKVFLKIPYRTFVQFW